MGSAVIDNVYTSLINENDLPDLLIGEEEGDLTEELNRVLEEGLTTTNEKLTIQNSKQNSQKKTKLKDPLESPQLGWSRKPKRKNKIAPTEEQLNELLNQDGIEEKIKETILTIITKIQRLTKIRQAVVDTQLRIDPYSNVLPELCVIQKNIYDTNRYMQYYLQFSGQEVPAFLLELGDYRLPEFRQEEPLLKDVRKSTESTDNMEDKNP